MKFAFYVLAIVAGIAFAYRLNPIPTSTKPTASPDVQNFSSQKIPFLSRINETAVDNPDGMRALVMKAQRLSGTTSAYTVLVREGTSERTIFAQSAETETTFSIPPNTWSPEDNTYVFIKEQSTAGDRFLVLKSSGQPFTEDEQYLDVNALFSQTPNKLQIRDITGWDAPQLLHVFTVTDDGVKGPAFWFNVETRTFLILASS